MDLKRAPSVMASASRPNMVGSSDLQIESLTPRSKIWVKSVLIWPKNTNSRYPIGDFLP
jgi:hypothetical protein